MFEYLRDPAAIYAESFRRIRAETPLDHIDPVLQPVAVRIVHACGMPEVVGNLSATPGAVDAVRTALAAGAPVLTDARMVAEGIIRARLPAANEIICTLNDPRTADHAVAIGNTRSAAAIDLWDDFLADAVVVIGNAPTALFRLLERLADGVARPAAILGFPVGFVGAAESKDALIAHAGDVPFITLRGRIGGSAIAAAALNAIAGGDR